MPNKLELTKKLTAQSDLWTVEEAMAEWWQNPDSGWRLNAVGFEAFEQYKLEHWDFETEVAIHAVPRVLLTLDRKLTGPYYIKVSKRPKLCFFASQEAVMYALYNDVNRFVASLQRY
jgi:hypothetical protein